MVEVSSLKKQRQIVKAAFTRMKNYCDNENVTLDEIQPRADRADQLLQQFESIQLQIDQNTTDENLPEEECYRSHIEEMYFNIKAKYHQLQGDNINQHQQRTQDSSEMTTAVQALIQHQSCMNSFMERFASNMQTNNTSTPNEHTAQTQSELRLPRVNLPEFDGNILNWVRFKELFEAFVHNRSNLSNIEKLEYLNSKLKGDALTIIKHLKPTANNYSVAWELLNKKYNNSENIKRAYMELLFDQPNIESQNLTVIKHFYNSINEGYNALKALDESVEQWSSVLLFNLEKKLDKNTATLWFREKKLDESSTFIKFLEFMERRVFELENTQETRLQSVTAKGKQRHPNAKQMRAYATTTQSCPVCSNNHWLYHCEEFMKMGADQRRRIVKGANLCFNCLRSNHKASDCELRTCKKCNKKHNTLLHMQDNNTQQAEVSLPQINPTTTNEVTYVNAATSQQIEQMHVILPTAIITILNNNKGEHKCRALLDSGSQGTLISEACVQRMGLKRKYDKTIIFGLGNEGGSQSRGKVNLKICAIGKTKFIETQALCLNNLTRILPAINIDNTKFDYFRNLTLADPNLHKQGEVDIILGADIFIECCLAEKIVHPSGSPTALNTIFGWVLMGRVQAGSSNQSYCNYVSVDIDQCLQRFWEIEEIQMKQQLTSEEEAAENYFATTTKRLENGRYEVRLPLKNNTINIGESKNTALKRLHAMERKFKLNKKIEEDYKSFMREYIQLGHMQVVNDSGQQLKCFLPHHAVMKPNSTTSKIRVVFDASSKSSNGKSLNDNLLVGPKVQRDLFDILITFRMKKIACVGDIEKMYRQVSVNETDRLMQCIIWRDNDSEEIKEYTLNTVTYGTAAASFLATRTLNQITIDNASLSPNTVKAIKDDFYVDDFMHSSEDVQQAIKLKDELCTALLKAGFNLRKWSSNSLSFLSTIPVENRALSLNTEIQHQTSVSTLGLIWNTEEDFFKFNSISYTDHQIITKRTVLSDIAKIYDPMGWISPTVVHMKIFMQRLWLKGICWDEPLAADLITEWKQIRHNIEELPQVKINRWLHYSCNNILELHGFSDASEVAYAAAVYAKVYVSNQKSQSYLIAAKTRVAPVKQITLPRLELCAAHLLVKLMSRIHSSISMNNIVMHGWTDSTIVLAWISDHPRRWKTFIANRTSQIINVLPAQQWHHIRSQRNPADLATRGISTKDLINSKLWWYGPDEIHEDIQNTPIFDKTIAKCDFEERQKVKANTVSIQECSYIERYSNFSYLIRITALILRFIYNCNNKQHRITGYITTNELKHAHETVIKTSQRSSFAAEIKILSSNKQLPNTHPLSAMSPFIDNAGVVRVGGRLNNAGVNYNQKHPMILDKKQHLTRLIIHHYHITHCHAGKRLLYYILQLKYWIPAVLSVIKAVIYKCTVCMRQRAIPYQQQMADLPEHRVVPAPVFSNVGIDFAGPFQVRAWKGRSGKIHKCWIAIFVCLVTKAIHIELVTDLSTATFIGSLRRFISRRGKPLHIYSDNGTNFVGANHHLADLYNFLQNDKNQGSIHKYLTEQQINWHFIPPNGPNFGGLWEAGVKAIKFHLKRVLTESFPTFEEMYTILCQIEGCLNSRPLCIKFEGDLDPLTPAHFLIQRAMIALPDENLYSLKVNHLSRWQYMQRLVYDFWKKWSIEYLNQLQHRHKWKQIHQNIGVNDVVLIKDENTAPSQWFIGRITQVHPGADGLIRVVTVKTKNGYIKRPITKLCPLYQES